MIPFSESVKFRPSIPQCCLKLMLCLFYAGTRHFPFEFTVQQVPTEQKDLALGLEIHTLFVAGSGRIQTLLVAGSGRIQTLFVAIYARIQTLLVAGSSRIQTLYVAGSGRIQTLFCRLQSNPDPLCCRLRSNPDPLVAGSGRMQTLFAGPGRMQTLFAGPGRMQTLFLQDPVECRPFFCRTRLNQGPFCCRLRSNPDQFVASISRIQTFFDSRSGFLLILLSSTRVSEPESPMSNHKVLPPKLLNLNI